MIEKHNLKRSLDNIIDGDYGFFYRMLDRLRTDCRYYLGNGGRNKKHLWTHDEAEMIALMREIYEVLPESPEWLTLEEIDEFAEEMGVHSYEGVATREIDIRLKLTSTGGKQVEIAETKSGDVKSFYVGKIDHLTELKIGEEVLKWFGTLHRDLEDLSRGA